MTWPESLSDVRYLTDPAGQKTDVVVPLATWEAMLISWDRMVAMMEDQEDREAVTEWLAQEASGEARTTSLDDLKRELVADGLLSS